MYYDVVCVCERENGALCSRQRLRTVKHPLGDRGIHEAAVAYIQDLQPGLCCSGQRKVSQGLAALQPNKTILTLKFLVNLEAAK